VHIFTPTAVMSRHFHIDIDRWLFSKWRFLKSTHYDVILVMILFYFRPCQIGILLSVNSSLTNLGTYLQKHTNRKRKHIYFMTKTMHYIYIFNRKTIIIIWNNGLKWLLLAWLKTYGVIQNVSFLENYVLY